VGGQLPPLEIFWPPLDDFCPPQTFILGHNSQGALVCESKRRLFFLSFGERWSYGQYDSPTPVKSFFFFFFWRTLEFRAIWLSNSSVDLFFLDNAGFWDRKQSLYREEPIFAMATLAPLVLPPCPRIVPAPLALYAKRLTITFCDDNLTTVFQTFSLNKT